MSYKKENKMKRFGYKLYAPELFWQEDWKSYLMTCNGCGTNSSKAITKPFFNSDYILKVNVRPACSIHDWQYASPKKLNIKPSNKHRLQCDRIFFNNLIRICEHEGERKNSWRITKWARKKVCWGYYQAVKHFGACAYWSEKNKDSEFREV